MVRPFVLVPEPGRPRDDRDFGCLLGVLVYLVPTTRWDEGRGRRTSSAAEGK
jgi:hypothetical protein